MNVIKLQEQYFLLFQISDCGFLIKSIHQFINKKFLKFLEFKKQYFPSQFRVLIQFNQNILIVQINLTVQDFIGRMTEVVEEEKSAQNEKEKKIQLIPIEVQIGAEVFMIKPQYPDTEMRLIQLLILALREQIPQDQKLYLNNWTKGPLIGKAIDPHQTIESLLVGSKAKFPTIRVSYQNCKTYKVIVDVHDIMILTYADINIFHYMIDIVNSVRKDIIKEFKLDKWTKFKLNFQGQFKKAKKMCFVGRYLSDNQTNHIKFLISFQETIPRKFVQDHKKKNYEQFICPISQMVVQQPVKTVCNHIFDKLCISLAIMKDRKCPICRKDLKLKDISSARGIKMQITQLDRLYTQEKRSNQVKEEEEQAKNDQA